MIFLAQDILGEHSRTLPMAPKRTSSSGAKTPTPKKAAPGANKAKTQDVVEKEMEAMFYGSHLPRGVVAPGR